MKPIPIRLWQYLTWQRDCCYCKTTYGKRLLAYLFKPTITYGVCTPCFLRETAKLDMTAKAKESADRVALTLSLYKRGGLKETGMANDETVSDMVTDLCHLCDRQKWNAADLITTAMRHWKAER